MADLTEQQAAQVIKITGSDSTGVETNYVGADSSGNLQATIIQNELVSTNNSSTANLAASATFTGTADSLIGHGLISVMFKADQAVTIQIEQSEDGTNWDFIDSYTVAASTGDKRSFNASASKLRVLVTNNGGSTTTFLRLQTILSPIGSPVSGNVASGLADSGNPVKVGGVYNSTLPVVASGQRVDLQLDASGRLLVSASPLPTTASQFTFGDVVTSSSSAAKVERTTYTEQTTNAQRSISSASANDTSAGTGARTIIITYYDQTGAGPFTETITLNGTANVNTVSTTICFIEKMQVATVGSGGVNAGIITLHAATAGGGAVIGTVAASDNQTFWAHHYVPSGKTSYISGFTVSNNQTTATNGAVFTLIKTTPTVANTPAVQVSDFHTLTGANAGSLSRAYLSPIQAPGPSKITAFVTPLTNTNQTSRASFDYIDN